MIINEVSMMSSSQLYSLYQCLRQLKGRSDLLFGGVRIVILLKMTLIELNFPAYNNNHHHYNLTNTLPTPFLCSQVFAVGFYQLLPIGDTLYDYKMIVKTQQGVKGHGMWLVMINRMVLLNEDFHAKSDPVWQGLLTRLRRNRLDHKDIKLLKSRRSMHVADIMHPEKSEILPLRKMLARNLKR
jgi:hypothetical protein